MHEYVLNIGEIHTFSQLITVAKILDFMIGTHRGRLVLNTNPVPS